MTDERQKILHGFQLLGRKFEEKRTLKPPDGLGLNLTKFCKKFGLDPETISKVERGLTECELELIKK